MDIRNFFAKKPSKKKQQSSSSSNNQNNNNDGNAGNDNHSSSQNKNKNNDSSCGSSRSRSRSSRSQRNEEIRTKKISPAKRSINDIHDDDDYDDDDDVDMIRKKTKVSSSGTCATASKMKKKGSAIDLMDSSSDEDHDDDNDKKDDKRRKKISKNMDDQKKENNSRSRRRKYYDDKDDDDDEYQEENADDNNVDDAFVAPKAAAEAVAKEQVKRSRTTRTAPTMKKTPSPASVRSPLSSSSSSLSPSPSKRSRTSPPSLLQSPTRTITTLKKKSTSSTSTGPPPKPTMKLVTFDVDNATAGCLDGLTFCFTGILSSSCDSGGGHGELSRDEATAIVKQLGGRVTTAVSKKTSYLIAGELLEDGRPYNEGSKYKRASQENETATIVVGKESFWGLLQYYSDKNNNDNKKNDNDEPAGGEQQHNNGGVAYKTMMAHNPYEKKATVVNPYLKKTVTNPYANNKSTKVINNPYLRRVNNNNNKNNNDNNDDDDDNRKPAAKSNSSSSSSSSSMLWVDKHKPLSSNEILGNGDCVRKLKGWLLSWEDTFNNNNNNNKNSKSNNKKTKSPSYNSPNGPWKAALLSGPPGIGKTTTATLLANESGRDVLEFNASDVRSKRALREDVGDMTGSHSFDYSSTGTNQRSRNSNNNNKNNTQPRRRKRVIIMDEVDGMGAGDRSGMSELIAMIKKSHVPIICICNDRQSTKMKSLLPYCFDLRFRRPIKTVIAKRSIQIASQYGYLLEHNAAEAIAESCGNDIRQVINCLQMWASNNKTENSNNSNNNTNTMTYKELKSRERTINKDEILRISLFDAAKIVLEGRRGLQQSSSISSPSQQQQQQPSQSSLSQQSSQSFGGSTISSSNNIDIINNNSRAEIQHFMKRNDAFFVDYSFVGLIVQQNYLKILQGQYNEARRRAASAAASTESAELDVLNRMHSAAQSMSDMTLVENGLRGEQNWSLLPFVGALTIKTGYHTGGERGGMLPGFPEFTTWLGRNSSQQKKVRLLRELHYHMNYKISCSGYRELRCSYLPIIRQRLLSILSTIENNNDSIDEAIRLMDDYGLDRDDVFEKLDEFTLGNVTGTTATKQGSKTKAATTTTVTKKAAVVLRFDDLDSKRKAAFTRAYNQGIHMSQALHGEMTTTASRKGSKRGSGGGGGYSTETIDPDAIDDDTKAAEEEEEEDNNDEDDDEKIKALFKKKKTKTTTTTTAARNRRAGAGSNTSNKKGSSCGGGGKKTTVVRKRR